MDAHDVLPDIHDYYPLTREARGEITPSEEEANRNVVAGSLCRIVAVRRLVLDRTDGEAIRSLAMELAQVAGERWERLGFERVVYWLHKAMVFADGFRQTRRSACSSSN